MSARLSIKTLILIDSNALIHRAYHALPPLKTKKGRLVNAVYGFVSILFKVIKDLKPDYLVAAFDLAGPTFRDLEYKEYKAKRVKPSQELYDQIPLIKEIIKALGIPIYEKQGFEADDIIGTIVQKTKHKKIKKIIITGDLDALQLVDRLTFVYTPQAGIKEMTVYDQAAVKKRYGLEVKQINDFKGLKGDPSDNVPGVVGIGQKTAAGLIKRFGSLKELYKNLPQSNLNPKLKAKLLEYKKDAFFSQYLVTVKKDVPLDFKLDQSGWGGYNKEKAARLLRKLEFDSLAKRLFEL